MLRPDLTPALRNRNRLERLLAQRAAAQAEAAARSRQAQSASQSSAQADEPASSTPPSTAAAAAIPQQQAQAGADWLVSPSYAEDPLAEEQRQAAEQWLREIPDNPAELLRRKFWYQQQQREENALQ